MTLNFKWMQYNGYVTPKGDNCSLKKKISVIFEIIEVVLLSYMRNTELFITEVFNNQC